MKCNCVKDMERKLLKRLREGDMNPPKGGIPESVSASDLMLTLKHGEWRLMIPFTARWKMPNGKSREKETNIIATHCPFCGASLEKKEGSK